MAQAQSRIVRWQPWSGDGLEHVEFQRLDDAVNVHSVVVGGDGDNRFGLHYHLLLMPGWAFHNLTLDTARPGFPQLSLGRKNGAWTNVATGAALPELDGCTDIDISATPLTNSLPIHRLALREGESAEILVAHLAAPDFVAKPVRQRYTRLGDRLYRFESLDGTGFAADLEVDEDGLVIDYPGLFRRVKNGGTPNPVRRQRRDPASELRPDWYKQDVPPGISMSGAGIYEWRIAGVGVYVGKARELAKRLRAYPRNVRDILSGRGWHGQEARPFRKVHYSLHKAYLDELAVSVTVLENCSVEALGERERYWIAQRRQEAAVGGAAVLNGT